MANNTSPHILNTSANLLGFCLIVITSLHIANKTEIWVVDEMSALVAVMLISSCVFSFFSIRTNHPKKEKLFETIADYLFLISLLGILSIILVITLNFL